MKNQLTQGVLRRYPLLSSMLMAIAENPDPQWAVNVITRAKNGRAFARDLVNEAVRKRHKYNHSAASREVSITLSEVPNSRTPSPLSKSNDLV